MNQTINQTQNQSAVFTGTHKVLIVAHRGMAAGAIPENTIPAFEIALKNRADIIEADVARTKDGVLVISHDRYLDRYTTGHGLIAEYSWNEICELNLVSGLGYVTDYKMHTLDDFLSYFKKSCLINLDQCDLFMDEAFAVVKRHNLSDQILFKTGAPIGQSLQWLARHDYEPLFMPIIRTETAMAEFLDSPPTGNIIAVELIIKNNNTLMKRENIQALQRLGKRIWVNALTLPAEIPAKYGDNVAILGDEYLGWGWLLEHGADIIQTDWLTNLHSYLTATGYR